MPAGASVSRPGRRRISAISAIYVVTASIFGNLIVPRIFFSNSDCNFVGQNSRAKHSFVYDDASTTEFVVTFFRFHCTPSPYHRSRCLPRSSRGEALDVVSLTGSFKDTTITISSGSLSKVAQDRNWVGSDRAGRGNCVYHSTANAS